MGRPAGGWRPSEQHQVKVRNSTWVPQVPNSADKDLKPSTAASQGVCKQAVLALGSRPKT